MRRLIETFVGMFSNFAASTVPSAELQDNNLSGEEDSDMLTMKFIADAKRTSENISTVKAKY